MSLGSVLGADSWEEAATLNLSRSDMQQLFALVNNPARLAVESLLGWTATLDSYPLTFTSLQGAAVSIGQPRSSLRVPFKARPVFSASGAVTFYAAQPHAFTRFAVDIAAALHVAENNLRHDQDLNPTLVPGVAGLNEWSTINQAVGVLVDRGETVESAQATLERTAAGVDLDKYRTAKKLLSNF